jgi:hypothetical protein
MDASQLGHAALRPFPRPAFDFLISFELYRRATVYLIIRSLLIRCSAFQCLLWTAPYFGLRSHDERTSISPMAKTTISASAGSKFQTKFLSDNPIGINTWRKPLKMTATLKRRALKKKTKQKEVQMLSGVGSTAGLLISSLPE